MYPGYAKKRIQLAMLGSIPGTRRSSTVNVVWVEIDNGTPDPVTGALVGGVQTELSGTLPGFIHEVSAATNLRQFAEIQTGDVIVDMDPDAVIAIAPGQLISGTIGLDDIADSGVRFLIDGNYFTQKGIGEELAQAWNAVFADQKLIRTIALRRAT